MPNRFEYFCMQECPNYDPVNGYCWEQGRDIDENSVICEGRWEEIQAQMEECDVNELFEAEGFERCHGCGGDLDAIPETNAWYQGHLFCSKKCAQRFKFQEWGFKRIPVEGGFYWLGREDYTGIEPRELTEKEGFLSGTSWMTGEAFPIKDILEHTEAKRGCRHVHGQPHGYSSWFIVLALKVLGTECEVVPPKGFHPLIVRDEAWYLYIAPQDGDEVYAQ